MDKVLLSRLTMVVLVNMFLSTSTMPSSCVSESSLNHSLIHLVSANSLEQVQDNKQREKQGSTNTVGDNLDL